MVNIWFDLMIDIPPGNAERNVFGKKQSYDLHLFAAK